MCGIIGYIGRRNAMPIVLQGLRKLEYRGYDSVGVVAVGDGGLVVKKDVGRVEVVHKKLNLLEPASHLAVGHTRWATHGGVTKENAHPQLDCSSSIAVVHNGIIENYHELRERLLRKGHLFRSTTYRITVLKLMQYTMSELFMMLFNCIKLERVGILSTNSSVPNAFSLSPWQCRSTTLTLSILYCALRSSIDFAKVSLPET